MSDDVSNLHKPIVGEVVRLEIPLQSVMNLRRVAEELRGLAAQLESIGRFWDGTAVGAMMEVRTVVSSTNKRLSKIRGRGRPKKSRYSY